MSTVFDEKVMDDGNPNINSLLKRVFIFLEDGDWGTARNYCERVLDIDPENALAYLGKLMAGLHVNKPEKLKDRAEPFDNNIFYKKAILFADEKLKNVLTGYIEHINNRNEKARLDEIYTHAKNGMSVANTETDYKKAALLFECISDYQDSMVLAQECYEKAEITRKNTILAEGKAKMTGKKASNYEFAIKLFESISGWKDADEQIIACQKNIEDIKAKKELNKKIAIVTTPIVCAIIAFIIVLNTVIIPNQKYNEAIALMEEGNYLEAYDAFVALEDYKDSATKASTSYARYEVERIKNAKVGDYVFFGAYEQDNDASNGKEEIEWLVLDVIDGKALLISRYALDVQKYCTDMGSSTTWQTCKLRQWLNYNLFNCSFTDYEKQAISNEMILTDGYETVGKVFLLSKEEVEKYFGSNLERRCMPTKYASEIGENGNVVEGYCYWWLRANSDLFFEGNYWNRSYLLLSMVEPSGEASDKFVFYSDSTKENGYVRPAMWIDLNY